MSRRRRFILLLMSLLPVALFLLAAGIYILVQGNRVTRRLDRIFVAEMEQRLQREVRIGRVRAEPLGHLIIYDLAIADGKTFSAGTMLTAKRVEVRYRWLDLVFQRASAAQTIESITLIRPSGRLTRLPSGAWNISSLFKPPPGPRRPPFLGVVNVVNGRVLIKDFATPPLSIRPAVNRVFNLKGTVDASAQPVIRFTASMGGNHVAEAKVVGRYNTRRKSLDIDVTARDADAVYWSAYRPVLEPFKVLSGRFDARMSIARLVSKQRVRWDYIGTANLKQVKATMPRLAAPITDVTGSIGFTNELATLDLRGVAAKSPLTAKGTVILKPKQNVRVAVESKALNYSSFISAFRKPGQLQGLRLEGAGPARALLLGSPKALVVNVSATVPRITYSDYKAADVKLTAKYAAGIIGLSKITAKTLNGSVAASGVIDVRRRDYPIDISGSATGVRLDLIPIVKRAGLSGSTNARFTLTGLASEPVLNTSVQVNRGNLNKVAFNKGVAELEISRGRLAIQEASAVVAGGAIKLNGVITANNIDLQTTALGVDAGKLLQALGFKGYAGVAYFRGRVSGPLREPVVVGTVEVFNGKAGNLTFDYARGQVAGTRKAIALSETSIKRYPTEALVSGRILNVTSGRPRFELEVNVKQADVKELAKSLSPAMDISGRLSGDFTITGTSASPRISGSFTLADGSVSGFPITTASGSVLHAEGTTTITNLIARSNGSVFKVEGSAAADGKINATLAAEKVSLALLNDSTEPYATLSGYTDITATATGTVKKPTVSASISSDEVEVNGQKFNKVSANITWDGKSLMMSDASLVMDGESYLISSLSYNHEERFIDAKASVTNGRIERLSNIVRRSGYLAQPEAGQVREILAKIPQPVTGVLTADISVTGKLKQLQGKLRASAANVTLGEQKVDSAQIEVSAEKGSVILDRFAAVSGDLNVTASGDIIKEGRIDLDIEAYNLDLALLRPWTGATGVTGVATVTVLAEGPIGQPRIQASVEMVSPTIRGFKFDRISASQILVSRNQLELSDVRFTRDDYQASVGGLLPWDWAKMTVPRDKPIELHAQVEKQSLALLSAFTASVEAEGTGGEVDGDVYFRGTIDKPDLDGVLSIVDGSINLKQFRTPAEQGPSDFKDIQARLVLTEDDIAVERFSGASSRGGTFSLSGTIGLANFPNGPVSLTAALDKIYFSEQNIFGVYNETVTARLASDLTVTGSLKEPVVAGSVRVADARIRIPSEAEKKPSPKFAFPLNPSFNVSITLGKDVWIYNPRLSAMVTGQGTLGGSILSPQVRATLVVQTGNIRLPTARPELRRGGTITVVYTPPEPTRVILDLEATASTFTRSGLVGRRRYEIVLGIRGPLNDLAITVRSEPPGLSQNQILAMLGHVEGIFDSNEVALKQEITDIFTAAVVPGVFSPIETAFAEAFGLEEFRLEYFGEEPLSVYLSRHLFGNFYGSYWRTVTAREELYRLSLSYRWTNRLQLTLITDEQRVGIVEVEGSFRF
ncbi:MAG: translocation/assembly module TamB domain-containing protein [Armatimonadota bacterium]|nr:translocation/assembly module TamB domain-containing protein [Armatimonadota bacterium]